MRPVKTIPYEAQSYAVLLTNLSGYRDNVNNM